MNQSDSDKFFATQTGKIVFSIVLLLIGFLIGMEYKSYQIQHVITDTLGSAVSDSLDSARSTAMDAKIQGVMSSARAQAELYYSSTGNDATYKGVCSDADFLHLLSGAEIAGRDRHVCNEAKDGSAWAASAPLSDNSEYACSDSTGVAKVESYPLGSATSCL